MTVTPLSADELRRLPPVVSVSTAAAALGISRSTAYELIGAGEWPTPVIVLRGCIRVPTAPLVELIGVRP